MTLDLTEKLKGIKYTYYNLLINTGVASWDEFKFESVGKLKKFLSQFQTNLGTKPTYTIERITKYFDDTDDYIIKILTETITPDELNDL